MRVTICELPHEPMALAIAWARLCQHTWQHESELLLLPEFAMADPVWESECVDPARWAAAETLNARWLDLLRELHATHVVGTRPATIDGHRFNQGYVWSAGEGLVPLRRKYYLPNEPGLREARWFERGDAGFAPFHAGALSFGLNICTELWALETYSAYAEQGVQLVLSPRATSAATLVKWLSIGVVAAVRSGAYSVSSNRVDPTGTYGGAGWIISPAGELLARTTADVPFVTVDLDLTVAADRHAYPRYVFVDD